MTRCAQFAEIAPEISHIATILYSNLYLWAFLAPPLLPKQWAPAVLRDPHAIRAPQMLRPRPPQWAPAKSAGAHALFSFAIPYYNISRAMERTFSAVKPNFSTTMSPGAEAPK
jgi:hypothetical protein